MESQYNDVCNQRLRARTTYVYSHSVESCLMPQVPELTAYEIQRSRADQKRECLRYKSHISRHATCVPMLAQRKDSCYDEGRSLVLTSTGRRSAMHSAFTRCSRAPEPRQSQQSCEQQGLRLPWPFSWEYTPARSFSFHSKRNQS